MKILSNKVQLLAVSAIVAAVMAGPAHAALDLTGAGYVTYGDGNAYALQVNGVIAGSTGPGSAFYVNSTPGAIQDLIVVATGASGGPVNTNVPGMDDALSTPSGASGSNFFAGIWNSHLAAFTGALGALSPLFFFNNHQIGGDVTQNLAVWAQVSLTGTGQTTRYFDFTNRNSSYELFTEGGGGAINGSVGAYTSAGLGPIAGNNLATDYVLSGGAVCLSTAASISGPIGTPVSCTSSVPHGSAINNNLGANQASYAIDVPELNAFLTTYRAGGFPLYTDIHVNLRFGCDPATVGGGTAGVGNCIRRDANNGFEQLFIGTSMSVTQVPEPGTLGLLALGMLSLAAAARRRKA